MEELWKLDTDALRSLHEQQQRELTAALLQGADWKDVQDKRRAVTELSIILYHRTTSTNPAEFHTRNSTEIKKPL